MGRYKDSEKLMAATREQVPAVAVEWLAALRRPLEKLTKAALSGEVSDAEFLALVKTFRDRLPELMEELDHDALAKLMEDGMGAAMANGIEARHQGSAGVPPASIRAKLPWETEVYLATGKGKKCGGSWIARWKQCGPDDGREWDEATAEEAAVLARLTNRPFKAGARILATPEGIRHAEKGHRHQIGENDWKNLRGRLFDPRTERAAGRSKNNEGGVSFVFRRGNDVMEAFFTLHFTYRKSPGELRLKTYAQRG
jgi:hypothetical protein